MTTTSSNENTNNNKKAAKELATAATTTSTTFQMPAQKPAATFGLSVPSFNMTRDPKQPTTTGLTRITFVKGASGAATNGSIKGQSAVVTLSATCFVSILSDYNEMLADATYQMVVALTVVPTNIVNKVQWNAPPESSGLNKHCP
jgi:hypothetical protein